MEPEPRIVLFLSSNTQGEVRLELAEEARAIENALHDSQLSLKTLWAVRFEDALDALNRHKPVMVHFAGHGEGVKGIRFHDNLQGNGVLVGAETLKRLFAQAKDDVRAVVLNACSTSEQARAIAEVIDFAVGMKGPIYDDAARVFAASFYGALKFGKSVEGAFGQGVLALSGSGLQGSPRSLAGAASSVGSVGADNLPELLVREGADPARSFIPPRPAARPPSLPWLWLCACAALLLGAGSAAWIWWSSRVPALLSLLDEPEHSVSSRAEDDLRQIKTGSPRRVCAGLLSVLEGNGGTWRAHRSALSLLSEDPPCPGAATMINTYETKLGRPPDLDHLRTMLKPASEPTLNELQAVTDAIKDAKERLHID